MTTKKIWVCAASGPSLCKEDLEYCYGKAKIAVTNRSHELLPHVVDLVHGADYCFWQKYSAQVRKLCPNAELWTTSTACARDFNLNKVNIIPPKHHQHKAGWCFQHGYSHAGGVSGFQLIQIVGWSKPDLIILLGYDMQHTAGKVHWHEDYPKGWNNCENIQRWLPNFEKLAAECPIPIINCSRETALTCFPRKDLREVL